MLSVRTISTFLFLFASPISFGQTMLDTLTKQELVRHGQQAYERRCVGCHGAKGGGQGTGAIFLDPKPRDFTSGIFKFRSTPLGTLPTDEDLMRTITQGVLGTSMPAFGLMPEVERFALVQYIKTFSDAWNTKENIGVPVVGARFPREDFTNYSKYIIRAKKGKEIYKEACMICHGARGKGDGLGGEGLVDEWGNSIRPGNLTKKYIKSGKSVRAIYRVLLSGLSGTPMPSFKGTYSDEQLWDLAAYVLYLRGEAHGVYGDNPPLTPLKGEF